MVAAELDDLTGTDAAYRIISWDDASIDIEPLGTSKTDEIKQPLMHILMESLKLKDEAATTQEKPPPLPKGRPKAKTPRPDPTKPTKRLIRLERAPSPQMRKNRLPLVTLAGIAVGIFAIIAVIIVATFHILDNRRISDGYQELVAKVERTDSLEKIVSLLEAYLEEHPNTMHAALIQTRIENARAKIEDREYEQVTLKISALPVDEHYETEAIRLFSQFLKKFPNSRHTPKINQTIVEIKNLLDKYYYEELVRAARLDFNQRLGIYKQYLSQFPSGSFRQDVQLLINEMGEKYLAYLKDESEQCERTRRWEPCIEHCENFITAYEGLALSEKAELLKKQLSDKRDYYELRRQADDAENDYQKAYQIYSRYLADHPQSTQKPAIEEHMAALDQKLSTKEKWIAVQKFANNPKNGIFERIQRVDRYLSANISGEYASEAQTLMDRLESERQSSLRKRQQESKKREELARIQRQKEEQARRQRRTARLQSQMESQLGISDRYQPNGDGTVTDRTSGLMWTILDSYQVLDGCVNYEVARQYIQGIRNGGYRDWRLPSASELAGIYKQAPFYPESGAQWYWSSEVYTKGFHSVVNIVTAKHETVYNRENRSLDKCGAVRAVRTLRP